MTKQPEAIKIQFPELRVNYLTVSFEDLQSTDIQKPDIPLLFTMLGFEEGNEAPSEMERFLSKITKKGDLLISEMQLLSRLDMSPIFYKEELMKKNRDLFSNEYLETLNLSMDF